MARVLVTGASGFIGRHLVAHLAGRGDCVRCLVRRDPAGRPFAPADVECVRGDVTDADSLADAVRGVEVVYHLAGATQVLTPKQYLPTNAEGTRNLVAACARQTTPPKVVFASSLAAAGPSAPDRPRTEADPPAPVSAYGRSKLAAEGHLRAAADRLPATVLRPPGVLGPGDPHTLPLFRAARWGVVGAPGSVRHRLSFIDVKDLARALVLAAERGAALGPDGERGVYFVALDETPTYADLGRLVGAAVRRRRVWTVPVPRPLCRAAARVNDLRVRLTGRPRLLTSDKVCEGVAGSWTCRTDKAKRELGFACQVGLAEALRRTAEWYTAQGWL